MTVQLQHSGLFRALPLPGDEASVRINQGTSELGAVATVEQLASIGWQCLALADTMRNQARVAAAAAGARGEG